MGLFDIEANSELDAKCVPFPVGSSNGTPGTGPGYAFEDHQHQLGFPSWTDWNGKITCGGNATNLTASGRYRIINYDEMQVHFWWTVSGALTAGNFAFAVPIGAYVPSGDFSILGDWLMLRTATARDAGYIEGANAGTTGLFAVSFAGVQLANNAPHTWAAGDLGEAHLRYWIVKPT